LRAATRDAHDRVERELGLRAMTSSLISYARALQILEASLSEALRGLTDVKWSCWEPDLQGLKVRHDWLREDLRALDHDPIELPARLALTTTGQGLGCLYVVEGAALGGQAIYTAAHRALSVTSGKGGRYFHGLGTQTVSAWQMFLDEINKFPASSSLGDEAERGALATFDLFEGNIARNKAMTWINPPAGPSA